MSYDILKNLGLDAFDTASPDFLKALDQMQKEAWQSLRNDVPGAAVGNIAANERPAFAAGKLSGDDIAVGAEQMPWADIPAWNL